MLKFNQLGFFFIYFSILTRFFQLCYIDLYGPFFSIELNRDIGIVPFSELVFLSLYLPFIILARRISYRQSDIIVLRNPKNNLSLKLVELILLVFICFLYISLFYSYPIPLFENMDRIEFNKITEGSVHGFFRNQFYLIISVLAYLFYYYKIANRAYSIFYVFLLLLIIFYCLLTGNRWSIFYTTFAFFVFVRSFFVYPCMDLKNNLISKIRNSKYLTYFFSLLLLFIIGRSIYVSFTVVRAYDNVVEIFFNRAILENVGVFQALFDSFNFDFHFISYMNFTPIDENKSKAMQFLMNEISFDNNFINQIEGGQVFSGGFPDFIFYVMNYFSYLPILGFSFLFYFFVKILLLDIVKKNILLFIVGIQCVFPFFLFFTSGFVDFLFNPMWYLKLLIFCILYIYYGIGDNSKLQF
jgi:hypothetical protein